MNRDYERRRDLLLLHADSPSPWTPAALGPVGRWSATDVLTSGAAVTAFVDLGSGGHNATQALAANQAQYAAAGNPAGGPQVTFDGNDFYVTAGFVTAQPFTFVIAMKPAWAAGVDVYADGLAAPTRAAVYTTNGTTAILQVNVTTVSGAAMITNDAWQTVEAKASGATSTIAANGGTRTSGVTSAESLDGVTIGAQISTAGNGAQMAFYELCLVSRALTVDEWARGNTYYHGKVGA